MAQKESQHVAIVDRLNEELANLQHQHDELIGSQHLQVCTYHTPYAVCTKCVSLDEDAS